VQGIHQVLPDDGAYSILLNEQEAIEHALDNAPENSLVVIFPDQVSRAIAAIMARNPIPEDLDVPVPTESEQENISSLLSTSVGSDSASVLRVR
jgi:cyanophycin synthetase